MKCFDTVKKKKNEQNGPQLKKKLYLCTSMQAGHTGKPTTDV